ncbi:hypothetical protein AXK12_04170 [Cephaloticoccus capnophilus]|uniref:Uncharacterized protein n=1 Tax=Cephaloticoccus capnophilus TaxID=1548208 RepID=A0A139SN88_9BACT|nr:hypothetical protein AXK12_04170 [Cephaloticoccus capnophilus]
MIERSPKGQGIWLEARHSRVLRTLAGALSPYAWGAAVGCFIWRRARWPAVHSIWDFATRYRAKAKSQI